MKRIYLNLLERIFSAEIEDRLPAQIGKSQAVTWLSENGHIEPMTITLGDKFPVTITGWSLTERGRMAYCESCSCHPSQVE